MTIAEDSKKENNESETYSESLASDLDVSSLATFVDNRIILNSNSGETGSQSKLQCDSNLNLEQMNQINNDVDQNVIKYIKCKKLFHIIDKILLKEKLESSIMLEQNEFQKHLECSIKKACENNEVETEKLDQLKIMINKLNDEIVCFNLENDKIIEERVQILFYCLTIVIN